MKLTVKKRSEINRDEKDISTITDFSKFCIEKLGIEGDDRPSRFSSRFDEHCAGIPESNSPVR